MIVLRPLALLLHAGLMSEQQRQEWSDAGKPSPLMRRMRAATRSAPWLLRLLARLSESGFGGRLLYNRVLKPAAGALSLVIAHLAPKSKTPYCVKSSMIRTKMAGKKKSGSNNWIASLANGSDCPQSGQVLRWFSAPTHGASPGMHVHGCLQLKQGALIGVCCRQCAECAGACGPRLPGEGPARAPEGHHPRCSCAT
jgi:hypothetical protein